ncbi:MAG: tripartite tricarboxylate transporter substrate-binding protein [Pseudomonadota bacterium]|nr:tripartite tricarboxylate transporter substrate-binding protein [Pseudomonadota bacterium]
MPTHMLRVMCAAMAALCASSPVPAQSPAYPARPIHLVVFVAPGGSADAVARLLSEGLGKRLGQPVLVENKGGAGGNLASAYVARARPDGYTLLLTANNHTVNPALFAHAGYDVRDFAAVAPLMEGPSVIAVPANSRFKTLADLFREARVAPGSIAYGSAGVGSPSNIAGELLQKAAGIRLNHIAYRGSGPSISDAVSGQIPVVIASLVAAMPQVEAGALRALAVTSKVRWPSALDVPAAAEYGIPAYEHMTWLGLFAPKATPQATLDRLNAEVQAVLHQQHVQERVAKLGGRVAFAERQAYVAAIEEDTASAVRLVRELNLKAD